GARVGPPDPDRAGKIDQELLEAAALDGARVTDQVEVRIGLPPVALEALAPLLRRHRRVGAGVGVGYHRVVGLVGLRVAAAGRRRAGVRRLRLLRAAGAAAA